MVKSIGGLVGAGASIFSGIQGAKASKRAAKQQAAQFQQSIDFSKGIYNDAQTNLTPFIQQGQNANPLLASFLGLPGADKSAGEAFRAFTDLPSYQFPLEQGRLQLNRQLSSTGLLGSPGAARAVAQLNEGYAAQGLQSYLSALLGLSNQGQGAAIGLGQIGGAQGNQLLQGYAGQGNALAGGTANAFNSLLGPNGGITQGIGALVAPNPNNGGNSVASSLINLLSRSAYPLQASTTVGPDTGYSYITSLPR